jgi:hypothetical protein
MQHRRTFSVRLDDRTYSIEVIYAALSGWMTIEVDGKRFARGWREWQTAFGGATLGGDLGGHRVEARITQPFDRQEYAFALRVGGELHPDSDPQPEPGDLKGKTLRGTIGMSVGIAIVVAVVQIVSRLT